MDLNDNQPFPTAKPLGGLLNLPPSPGREGAPLPAAQLPQERQGFGNTNPNTQPVQALPNIVEAEAKARRADLYGTLDKGAAMVRQDWLHPGIVTAIVGSQFVPDPSYTTPGDKGLQEELQALPAQYRGMVSGANSAAHAQYLLGLAKRRMADDEAMQDLGVPGHIARFLIGMADPIQLAIGVATGGAYSAFQAARGITAASRATAGGIAAASAVSAAESVGITYALNRLNRQDDTEGLLQAALLGGVLGGGFHALSVNRSFKAAQLLREELEGRLPPSTHDPLLAPERADVAHARTSAPAPVEGVRTSFMAPPKPQLAADDLVFLDKLHAQLEGDTTATIAEMRAATTEHAAAMAPQADAARLAWANRLQSEGFPVAGPEWHGKLVTGVDSAGSSVRGAVVGQTEDGHLRVLDPEDGTVHEVRPAVLDQDVLGDTPDGFVHRGEAPAPEHSIGAQQVHGSTLAATTPHAVLLDVKGVPARFDDFAVLNGSTNESVRELAFAMLKDPVGVYKEKGEWQPRTVAEYALELKQRFFGEFMTEFTTASRGAREAIGVRAWDTGFDGRFADAVTAHIYGDRAFTRDNPQALPFVEQAARASSEARRKALAMAQEKGVLGADQVSHEDSYVNRQWDHGKMRDVAIEHGQAKVEQLVADAILDKGRILDKLRRRPGNAGKSDGELLLEKARGFLRTLQRIQYDNTARDLHLADHNEAAMRAELEARGLTPDDADNLLDLLFRVKDEAAEATDAGRVTQLKYRFGLDPLAEIPGTGVKLHNLWNNDIRELTDSYVSGMAGHSAFADHYIPSEAAWRKRLAEIKDRASEDMTTDGRQLAKELQRLEDHRASILGRPMSMEQFSPANRALGALQGYVRSTVLPQLGIAASMEVVKALGMFGARSMWRHIGGFREFVTALRKGHMVTGEVAQQVQHMTGMGYEAAVSYVRLKSASGDGKLERILTGAENVSNVLSHAANVASGNRNITSMTQHWAAIGAAQQLADVARGAPLSPSKAARWAANGLDPNQHAQIFEAIHRYSSVDSSGTLKTLDWPRFSREEPHFAEQTQLFLRRQAMEAIQQQVEGEGMQWLKSPIGKIIGELRTFFLVGHAKNFLKNVEFRDATSARIFVFSFMAESLAFSVQTAINAPDKLDERLTPDNIGRAALARMAILGTTSFILESGFNVLTGGDSLFQGEGITANTDSRTLWRTPSLQALSRLGSAGMTLTGAVLGTDTTTQKEARDVRDLIPLARWYGLRYIGDQFLADLPRFDPEKKRLQP